jgi:CubicO group peptidase (beta-lactamase class C family)
MKGRILPLAKLISLGVLLTLVVLIPAGRGLAQDVLPQPDQPLGQATQARELDDPGELEDLLDGVMSENLESYHIPGATVAVVKDSELFFAKGYGYADLEDRRPAVADETLFRVGSVGKPFTATAVMQLVEEGKLDLNADVNTYLEDFKIPDTYPQPITLHHLLTHTAGFEDRIKGVYARNAGGLRPLDEFLAEDMPARVRPPGEFAAYSNYGLTLAGYIVEQVSGMPYDRYVEENILEPLDMRHTTTRQPLPPELAGNVSVGYSYANGGYEAEEFEFYNIAPAGSMSATATDMAHFMISHLQNGRYGDARILQEETAKEMHRRHFSHDPKVNGIGYGFMEMDRNGQRIVMHGGETSWFRTALWLFPEQDVGLFVSYNSAGGEEAREELFDAFLDRYYPAPDPPVGKPPADFLERADRFTGSYWPTRAAQTTPEKLNALTQMRSVSATEDGALLTRPLRGDPQRWVEVEPLVFREVGGEGTLVFRENGQGRITHLFFDVPQTWAYVRLAWYETPAFHAGLLAVCVVLFLSAIVVWPVGALLGRRKREAGAPRPSLSRLARWLAGGVGALSVLYLIGYPLALIVVARSNLLELVYGDSPLLRAMQVLPLLIVVLAASALALTVPAWIRRYWGVAGRVHYTLVVLAGLAFVWFLYYWNLLEELWY